MEEAKRGSVNKGVEEWVLYNEGGRFVFNTEINIRFK